MIKKWTKQLLCSHIYSETMKNGKLISECNKCYKLKVLGVDASRRDFLKKTVISAAIIPVAKNIELQDIKKQNVKEIKEEINTDIHPYFIDGGVSTRGSFYYVRKQNEKIECPYCGMDNARTRLTCEFCNGRLNDKPGWLL